LARDEERQDTRIKPVPGVTWLSRFGCGALLGLIIVLRWILSDLGTEEFFVSALKGLGFAVIVGLLVAYLDARSPS